MKKRKRNKKGKTIDFKLKVILVIIFILIDIFLITCFLKIRDASNYSKLNKEFDKAIKVDITVGNYNERIVSGGRYKEVEKYIKDYFNDYSNNVKDILKVISDEEFTKLLSVDNYSSSNGNFTEDINYVINTKDSLDNKFEHLNTLSTYKGLKKYINKKTDDKYTREVFLNIMTSEEANTYFDDNNELLDNKKNEIDNILDVSRDVFYFLTINNGKWIITDGQIKFSNTSLMNQYNEYISKLGQ